MIEERGQVVAVDGRSLLLETVKKSACQACTAKNVCGHGLKRPSSDNSVSHRPIRALCDISVNVGDTVVIGIPDSAMLQASFWLYLVPLLFFVVALFFGHWLALSEVFLMVVSLLGLALGFFFTAIRWRNVNRQRQWQPVVLKRERTQETQSLTVSLGASL